MPANADLAASLALLGSIAVALAAYGLRRAFRGRVDYDRVRQQGGTIFLGNGIMTAGYWLLQPAVRWCVGAGIQPAVLTWLSLAPAAAATVAAARGVWGLAAWGLFLSSLLDVLDGAVARAGGSASKRGAILDSTLDRYAEFMFFAGVLVCWRQSVGLQLLCFAAVAGSVLVTYSTAKAEALGLTPPRGLMKRSDRMACLIAGSALSPLLVRWSGPAGQPWPAVAAVGLIAVLGNLSAIQRFRALAREAASGASPRSRG